MNVITCIITFHALLLIDTFNKYATSGSPELLIPFQKYSAIY